MQRLRLLYSLLIGILLMQATNVLAQHPNLKFEHFDSESGLTHSNVIDVLQDSQGFIWIGTERGLSRFDGKHFKAYRNDPTDPKSIYDHFVMHLVEDKQGIIWIGAREALIRFDPLREEFTSFLIDPDKPQALHGFITDLMVDEDGDLWIAAAEGGLSKLDTRSFEFEHFRIHGDTPSGMTGEPVLSLGQDADGLVWAGLEGGGVDRIDPKSGVIDHFRPQDEGASPLPAEDVNTIYTDSTGTVWLGTDVGLSVYDAQSGSFEQFVFTDQVGDSTAVYDITTGSGSSLWLGTSSQGLIRFDPQMRSHRPYSYNVMDGESIGDNLVYSVIQDNSGNVWAATNGSLSKADLHHKPILVKRHSPAVISSLSSNTILGLTKDAMGDLWVATINGLNQYDMLNDGFIRYYHDVNDARSISGNEMWSAYTDSKGNLWFGAYGEGINRKTPWKEGFDHFKNDPKDSTSFQGETAFTFYEDSEQRLWVGSELGLNLFDPTTESFRFFSADSTGQAAIRAIHEDQYGIIWLGTEGDGLMAFNPEGETFTAYEYEAGASHGLASVSVLMLFKDSDDIMWIGTDRGLNRLLRDEEGNPTGKFELYLERDGLSDNGIVGMLEDDDNNLWITTSMGLTRVAKVYHRGQGKKKFTLRYRVYDHHDGLASSQFYIGPAYKDEDGLFYLGGDRGVSIFDPRELQDNPLAPDVVISDIKLANKSLVPGEATEDGRVAMDVSAPYAKQLDLNYKDRVVTISFAALHFAAPEKNQFKYRLEGFEEQWIDAGKVQQATYTNLPAGDYTFRVIASNLDGKWNNGGASIKISVAPPFWDTTWFKLLASLFALLTLYGIYQRRVRSMRHQNRQLENKVAVRTSELRDKNVLLEQTNEELTSINAALKVSNYNLELRSQELKEALEKNKEILGITAHDLKNPLGGVIGLAEVVIEDSKVLDEKQYFVESLANVNLLKNEAEHMLRIIRDMLDRYREEHIEELNRQKANLNDAVQTVLRWNHKAARDKEMMIIYDDMKDAVAEVDLIAIQRAMDNLISNAVKYNPPGEEIHVMLERKEKVIRFSVRDNGQGLTSEDKGKVFGKLQRLSAKPTAGEHSTGLGLYIVKKLVEMHQGHVGVESEYGNGATFWFEVPAFVSSLSLSSQ